MDPIQYCSEATTDEELKSILLERNKGWMAEKNGVNDYNDSLKTVVLGCIDSRVPIEKIFQAKPGELLVLKNAGNLVKEDVIRSVLAAIYEIKAKFVVILGHTRCGMSILNNEEKITDLKAHMGEDTLKKIADYAKMDPLEWFGFFDEGEWRANAKNQAEILQNALASLIPGERMPCILTALYDLDSGKVEFF